jgi:hypothetical protein
LIQPGQQVDIQVRDGAAGNKPELEHTAEGLIVHGWVGCVVSVFSEGEALAPNPQERASTGEAAASRVGQRVNIDYF